MASENQTVFKILEELNEEKHWSKAPDCKIVTEDGELDAHKIILAKASPMIRAHFYGDVNSGNIHQIESHFSKDVMDVVRYYAYRSDLELAIFENKKEQFIYEVICAANFYLMEKLAVKCSLLLINSITSGNVLQLINLAAREYNLQILFDFCFQWLCASTTCTHHGKQKTDRIQFICCMDNCSGADKQQKFRKQFTELLSYDIIFDITERFCILFNKNSSLLYTILNTILQILKSKCNTAPDKKTPQELKEKYTFFKHVKIHYLNESDLKKFLEGNQYFFTTNEIKFYSDLYKDINLRKQQPVVETSTQANTQFFTTTGTRKVFGQNTRSTSTIYSPGNEFGSGTNMLRFSSEDLKEFIRRQDEIARSKIKE